MAGDLEKTKTAKKDRGYSRAATVLLVLVGILAAVVLTVHIVVRAMFGPFYANAEDEFALPGLDTGFVPQDIAYVEGTSGSPGDSTDASNGNSDGNASASNSDGWLVSGYMKDGSASPVYLRKADGSVARISVEDADGNAYDGHGSGISDTDDYVFLTCDRGFLVFDSAAIENASDGDTVKAIGKRDLEFTPSFLNVQNGSLYVGEFYHAGKFETDETHHVMTPDGSQNNALMYVYRANDESDEGGIDVNGTEVAGPNDQADSADAADDTDQARKADPGEFGFEKHADCVYSIPEKVQGVALTGSGNIVLSTSYGFAPSHLQSFDRTHVVEDGTFIADGREVTLYCLDSRNLITQLALPPMSEGIVAHDGSIYVSEESASSKYIFGRLYGAGSVFAVNESVLEPQAS